MKYQPATFIRVDFLCQAVKNNWLNKERSGSVDKAAVIRVANEPFKQAKA